MNELHLQDKFLVPFLVNELGYREVKANTVSNSLIIEEDLEEFISDTSLNRNAYENLLRKYKGKRTKILKDLIDLIQERIGASRNTALFLNQNKSVTLKGVKLYLFYPSDSLVHGDKPFGENIFSVVQEFPYKYTWKGEFLFAFRPDLCFFVNGIYLGYSELKNNYTNQNARKNGRRKVIKDYFEAVRVYHKFFDSNDMFSEKEKEMHRKDFLKIFEKAIHISATDVKETYILRTLTDFFDDALLTCREGKFDREEYDKKVTQTFKSYPLLNPNAEKKNKLKEVFGAHYSKRNIEKEILYYNFIERDVYVVNKRKELKDEKGQLIAPRPKQKFGTDKILAKIDEFLAHEQEDDYFEKLLEKQLAGVSEARRNELLNKRRKYSNNRNVYSLLMQYAAGFGKSNIIGWTALQMKDLIRNGTYVYDKIMIVVDRLQLRSQIDSKMLNMNIDKKMYIEAHNKKTFQEALKSDIRLVIVNLQKFGAIREMLDSNTIAKLAKLRTVFLIDEIHRSQSGEQHEEMISIFDELQDPFDKNANKLKGIKKKNLIIGFTATPSDHTLARFGEFSGYAESEKLWVPFDSYTMKEAIEDDFILNPLKNIVPIASKMLFDLPKNKLEGFWEKDFRDAEKKQIYEDLERIQAIAKYVADLLVKDVYRQIRGTGKAMLAVYSIKSAIAYKEAVTAEFKKLVTESKYEKFKEAPIYIVYSDNQEKQKSRSLNEGLSEEKVLQKFALAKNALIIVVSKLQTGFDDRKLHTLFLDKEVKGIPAIQTISRVNRKIKYKNDCKIIDFSYNNVNVQNIKDAFEHFSNVVVSDWDPFADDKVLDILYKELYNSEIYEKFYESFVMLIEDAKNSETPDKYLDWESSLEKYIYAHPRRTADIKAKTAQYFTILNRIEYVISLDKKFSSEKFLLFFQKYNTIYNILHRQQDIKDPIEVYFDNQIGIIETIAEESKSKKKKTPRIAEGRESGQKHKYNILRIIEARNEQQAALAELIKDFELKIQDFFQYIKDSKDGQRLVVKINSHIAEDELYEDFSKIYRRYRALKRKTVGDYFFKETEDLKEKLCDDFELEVRAIARKNAVQKRLKTVSNRLLDDFSETYRKLAE